MTSGKKKKCCRCQETKEYKEFGVNRSTKTGRADYCFECSRILSREAYKRRYQWVYDKFNNKCVLCGTFENLHVHHLHGKINEENGDLVLACKTCHIDIFHQGAWHKKLPTLSCIRCNHVWFPRADSSPRVCPKCKSPYWDRERQPKRNGIIK